MGHPKIVGQKSYYTNFQQGIKLEKKHDEVRRQPLPFTIKFP